MNLLQSLEYIHRRSYSQTYYTTQCRSKQISDGCHHHILRLSNDELTLDCIGHQIFHNLNHFVTWILRVLDDNTPNEPKWTHWIAPKLLWYNLNGNSFLFIPEIALVYIEMNAQITLSQFLAITSCFLGSIFSRLFNGTFCVS